MNTKSLSRIIKQRMRDIGIDSERVTAHSLRHTAATTLLANGVALPDVQNLLAHKDIKTTMIYQHEFDRLSNPSESLLSGIFLKEVRA